MQTWRARQGIAMLRESPGQQGILVVARWESNPRLCRASLVVTICAVVASVEALNGVAQIAVREEIYRLLEVNPVEHQGLQPVCHCGWVGPVSLGDVGAADR